MVEKSATVNLTAGYHPLVIEYFEAGGGAGLIMSYSWAGKYQEIGAGYCNSYYIGGQDEHHTSLASCLDKCNMSPECAFVSFVQGKTCNRYSTRASNCVSSHNRVMINKDAQEHTTYQKIIQGITKQVVPASMFHLERGMLLHPLCTLYLICGL